MTKRRKRKKRLKLKKKNFIIFLILVFLVIFSITKTITFITDKLSHENKTVEKKETKKKTNNPYEQFDYYVKEYDTRYKNYKKKNPSFTNKQIVMDVNMDLDKEVFKDATKAKNINTNLILVNKYNYLDKTYEPNNLETISNVYALSGQKLRKEAKQAFEEMGKAASKEKLKIVAMSSYRSYEYQEKLYNQYKKKDGESKADTYSGRPGYSEHQAGLSVDVYDGITSYTNFEKTKEFIWMKKNAYKYGFILRFPENKTRETGYVYESWHYRYVGIDAAKYIYENDLCLEEYYATVLIKKRSSN